VPAVAMVVTVTRIEMSKAVIATPTIPLNTTAARTLAMLVRTGPGLGLGWVQMTPCPSRGRNRVAPKNYCKISLSVYSPRHSKDLITHSCLI
jgi:hypothetical protein